MTTIDLTPTWAGLLPALLAAVTDGTAEGRQIAIEELERMAGAADRWNENATALVDLLSQARSALSDQLPSHTMRNDQRLDLIQSIDGAIAKARSGS